MVDIKEHIEKGYIHTRIVLEIIGKPKEHVKETIEGYVKKINNDTKNVIVKKFMNEIKPIEKSDMFSTFVELEMLIKGFEELSFFCFNYMPASIEILEPNKILADANKMTNLFNDFQSKLHRADFLAKTLSQKNEVLITNFSLMIKNMLFILLKDKGMTLKDICRFTGLKEEDMAKYLESLINEKKIKKIGDKYFYQF